MHLSVRKNSPASYFSHHTNWLTSAYQAVVKWWHIRILIVAVRDCRDTVGNDETIWMELGNQQWTARKLHRVTDKLPKVVSCQLPGRTLCQLGLGRFTFPHAHVRLKDVFSVLYTYPTDIPTNTVSYLGSTSFGLRRILTTSNMDRSRLFSVCCLILA